MRWYNPSWINEQTIPAKPADLEEIRSTLINAVVKRLMADVPFGARRVLAYYGRAMCCIPASSEESLCLLVEPVCAFMC